MCFESLRPQTASKDMFPLESELPPNGHSLDSCGNCRTPTLTVTNYVTPRKMLKLALSAGQCPQLVATQLLQIARNLFTPHRPVLGGIHLYSYAKVHTY